MVDKLAGRFGYKFVPNWGGYLVALLAAFFLYGSVAYLTLNLALADHGQKAVATVVQKTGKEVAFFDFKTAKGDKVRVESFPVPSAYVGAKFEVVYLPESPDSCRANSTYCQWYPVCVRSFLATLFSIIAGCALFSKMTPELPSDDTSDETAENGEADMEWTRDSSR